MTTPIQRHDVLLRGEPFSLLRAGPSGGAPELVWTHATGFNARTYAPLLRALGDHLEIGALDMRGHGFTDAVTPEPRGWRIYRDDLIAYIDTLPAAVWLAGHSMGATVSIAAAARRPERVRGLILIEPVLLAGRFALLMALAQYLGISHRFSLAASARARRAEFPSAEAAVTSYLGRGAFRTWPEEWVREYVAGGTRQQADVSVRLACSPAWESATFAGSPTNPWPDIRALRCPLTLAVGRRGSTCPPPVTGRLRSLQPDARIVTVPQASHFLPMEHSERVMAEILDRCGRPAPDQPAGAEASAADGSPKKRTPGS